jgi:hypothetical protein
MSNIRIMAGFVGLLYLSAMLHAGEPVGAGQARADENLIVIADPLPHLQELLSDARIRRVLAGELGRQVAPGGQPDLDAWWKLIDGRRSNIPREIVIAIPESAIADWDNLVQAFLWGGLSAGAVDAGDQAREDLPKLQDQMIARLRQLRLPQLRIWLAMRDANMAIGMLNLLRWQVPNFEDQPGLTLTAAMGRISAELDLGVILPGESRLVMLDEMGVISGEDDPKARAMSDAIGALKVRAVLEQREDGLLLTLGSAEAGQPLPDLPAAIRQAAGTIVAARWDITSLKQASRRWLETWEKWADTPAGRAAADLDDEDLIGDLQQTARDLEKAPDRGVLRLWRDDGLHLQIEAAGAPAAAPLAGSTLLRAVPAGLDAVLLDSRENLGESLSSELSDVEARMNTQWLKAMVGGREEQADRLEMITEKYYQHLAGFRELVHDRLPQHFEPPVAHLADSRGRIARLEIGYLEGAQPRTHVVRDVPMYQLAMLGRAKDPTRTGEAVREMYAQLISGLFDAVGMEAPAGAGAFRAADLDVGVPVQALDGRWIAQIDPRAQVMLNVEGDLVPHYFMLDDVLVMSLSPALSRRIAAAWRTGEGRMDASALQGQPIIAWWRISRAAVAGVPEHLAAWLDALAPERAAQNPSPQAVFRGLGELARLVDGIELQTTQQEDTHITRARVRLAP